MSQIAIILLFLCQQTAFSFGAGLEKKPSDCRDTKRFCHTLTNAQCGLRVAKKYCPETCQSCDELPLSPETSTPECSDDRDDCEDAFYICGVYANYEKKCSKTCELCPAQQDDAIRKCVSKNHKDFCYKLESVCSSMLGVPLPSFAPGSSHKLPPNVAHCVSSENRMAVCHVKHGSDFCYKLEAACARINNVPLPQQTPGSEYKLPEQVAACMSKEEVMAVCEAKHGAVQCNSWKESCTKKRKGAHELSGEEKECIKTQSVMATCKSKYGDHCLSLQGECAGIYGVPAALLTKNGIYKMASIVESCVDLGGTMATCISNHNASQCYDWERKCTADENAPSSILARNSYHFLPPAVASCVLTQDIMERCQKKFGLQKCYSLDAECKRIFGEPSVSYAAGSLYRLSPQVIGCMVPQI